jgi:hypothetical protein
MAQKTLPTLVVLTLVACTPAAPEPDPAVGESTAFTQSEAAGLLLEAAAIPRTLLKEVTDLGAALHPDKLSTFPLSMLMFGPLPAEESEDFRLLASPDAPPLSPRQMWVEAGPGRVTLFPAGSIRIEEFDVEEKKAVGTFHFRRDGMWEGHGNFRAEQTPDGWRIVEAGLPAMKAVTRLRDDGTWGLADEE